ncbi:MAG: hypothetical protein AAGF23_05775, partial [Acidobacteriota bacterium]
MNKTPRRAPILTAVLCALVAQVPLFAQSGDADPAPVVIAVDTSRSLAPSALDGTKARLREVLGSLDPRTPTALLAFDDSPRWLAGPGAEP